MFTGPRIQTEIFCGGRGGGSIILLNHQTQIANLNTESTFKILRKDDAKYGRISGVDHVKIKNSLFFLHSSKI